MRVLFALVILVSLQFVPGRADAATTRYAYQSQAFAGCEWTRKNNSTYAGGSNYYCRSDHGRSPPAGDLGIYYIAQISTGGMPTYGSNGGWSWGADGCPSGATWNEVEGKCNPTQAECLAHNSEPGFIGVGEIVRPFTSRCVGGCVYEAQEGAAVTTAGGSTLVSGVFEFSGDTCGAEFPPLEEEAAKTSNPQECASGGVDAAGREYTYCVKSNGEQCWTASSGKQICWTAGEVGEKSDGPVLQKRNAGTTTITPSTAPPEGSTFSPQGPSITTQTSVSNITINTTTQNYQTDTGVNAGPVESGEPADGTGGTDSEEKEGSVVGGEGCDTPPEVSGGDPLLQNIILQTWGTRCAAEDANAVRATGNIEDCSSPFTVTGPDDDPNTHKLRAIRKNYCPDESDLHPEGASGDYGIAADGDEGTLQGQVFGEGVTVGEGGLDDSGFGWTRVCPQMPVIEVMGATLDFNLPEMCDWMKLGGQLVLILAALASLKLMAAGM